MKRTFGGFLGFLSWLWLVISAVYMYMCILNEKFVDQLFKVPKGRVIGTIIVGALFFIAYFYIRTRLMRMRATREVQYANALGEISIALSAIEEAMDRLLTSKDIVRSHDVSISDDHINKKLRINAQVSFWEVNDLPSKIAELQQDLKKRFDEIIPDAESVMIKVKLTSFIPRPKTRDKKKTEKEDKKNTTDETNYFTGLKYPIGTDEEED